jgi:hypothetical protein
MAQTEDMEETRLKLIEITGDNPPKYKFESLGGISLLDDGIIESKSFPIGTQVYLTSGKFPIDNYLDQYKYTGRTHTLGNKVVELHGNTVRCKVGQLEVGCKIKVKFRAPIGGKRRSTRRRNRRRSTSRKLRAKN